LLRVILNGVSLAVTALVRFSATYRSAACIALTRSAADAPSSDRP